VKLVERPVSAHRRAPEKKKLSLFSLSRGVDFFDFGPQWSHYPLQACRGLSHCALCTTSPRKRTFESRFVIC